MKSGEIRFDKDVCILRKHEFSTRKVGCLKLTLAFSSARKSESLTILFYMMLIHFPGNGSSVSELRLLRLKLLFYLCFPLSFPSNCSHLLTSSTPFLAFLFRYPYKAMTLHLLYLYWDLTAPSSMRTVSPPLSAMLRSSFS